MNNKSIGIIILVIALSIQSSLCALDFLCEEGECLQVSNLLCTLNNSLSVEAGPDGGVDIGTLDFINAVIDSRPNLQLTNVVVTPDTFSCKLHNSVQAVINATDDMGNCFIQNILTLVDDNIPPVITAPAVVNLPAYSCSSLFGGLCYINLLGQIPEALVTDNCMTGSTNITGNIVSTSDLVGNLLHLPFASFGSYNISFTYTDGSGNNDTANTIVNIQGIQVTNPLPFTLYILSSLIKTTMTVAFEAYSAVDTTAQLYLRNLVSGLLGTLAGLESDAYVLVGTFDLDNTIHVASDTLLHALQGAQPGAYFVTLYLPNCGCFSVNDPIVTLTF